MRTVKLTIVMLILLATAGQLWMQRASAGSTSQSQSAGPANTSNQKKDRIADLEERSARQPGNTELQGQLGLAYFYKARLGDAQAADKAIAVLERQVAAAPTDIAAARWLGLSHFVKVAVLSGAHASNADMIAELERTLTAFDRVLALAPTDAIALSSHGSALTFMARYKMSMEPLKKGMEEMNHAVTANPGDNNPRLLRGLSLINLPAQFRSSKDIEEDFKAVLKGLPAGYYERAQGSLHVLLGDLYVETKDSALARAEYEAAGKLQQPAAEVARGRLADLQQGQPGVDAIQNYRERIGKCSLCHDR